MKRNYIAPCTAVYQIETSKLIAESLKLDNSKTLDTSGEILTKESESWDIWGSDDDE